METTMLNIFRTFITSLRSRKTTKSQQMAMAAQIQNLTTKIDQLINMIIQN
jgi:hypothetical protein